MTNLIDRPEPIWAVVPAAGVGARMGSEVPKQYLQVAGQTILGITLKKLLACPRIEKIIVALSTQDDYFESLDEASSDRVIVVEGGKERADSVLNGVCKIQSELCGGDAWVLVHDAARPCVSLDRIAALCELVVDGVGGILACPATDTLKRVQDGVIETTIPRDGIWRAHTPQLFPIAQLKAALEQAFAAGRVVTDESSAIELAGFCSKIVEDRADNIKVTLPEDLAVAERILKSQSWCT